MENQVKELERSVGEESSLLKDRQRIIDLYEQAGYLSFKDATDARVAAQEDFVEKIRALYLEQQMLMEIALRTEAKTTQDKLKLQDQLAAIAVKREKLERDAQQSNLERVIRQPSETLKDLQEQAQRGQIELSAIEEQIKTQRENRAITEIQSLNQLADARARSAEQLRMLANQARKISEAAPGNDKLADAFRRIEEAARRASDAAESLRQRARELSDPAAGVSKGLKDVAEEAAQVGKQMEDATRRAFGGMTDALTEFVMTGKLNFRSLALSIIQDLIRIQIQSAIVGPLAKALGGMFSFGGAGAGGFQTDFNTFSTGNTAFAANGGIIGSRGHMPLNYFANGGIANSPQLAVFGEGSRPEAFVPLPDGRSIPVTMNGGMGGSTSVVVNVNVESGQASTVGEGEGASLGKLIASAVQSEIIRQKRNGGLLAGA
jgi:lambda family phage tail tape measure protein